jgi:hypothetical protein
MAGELVPQPGRGRPSQFNQERATRLIQAVRGGNYLRTAAAFAGISYSTLRRWLLKADDPEAPPEYVVFKEELEKARADAEVAALAKVQKAASEGDWRAAQWFLERSFPDHWGKTDTARIELVGQDGAPVRMVAGVELNAEGMTALAQRVAARLRETEQEAEEAEILDVYAEELDAGAPEVITDTAIEMALEAWEDEENG